MSDLKISIDRLVNPVGEETASAVSSDVAGMPMDDELELNDSDKSSEIAIQVDFEEDIEPIKVSEIIDTHGRLSDIIENLESETGLSVIPLRMANIAPEVSQLQRHEIFTFAGERYAFSRTVRKNVCDRYLSQIVSNISEGVPFSLDLVTSVAWGDDVYKTLLLSRVEWTYILSKCREFKQSFTTDKQSRITMQIFAERI